MLLLRSKNKVRSTSVTPFADSSTCLLSAFIKLSKIKLPESIPKCISVRVLNRPFRAASPQTRTPVGQQPAASQLSVLLDRIHEAWCFEISCNTPNRLAPWAHAISLSNLRDQGEGKVHPRTGHEDLEGKQRYSSTFCLTSVVINATPRTLYPQE